MKKFWNFIQNEDTSETELLFNGPISEDTWWGDEVTPAFVFVMNSQKSAEI